MVGWRPVTVYTGERRCGAVRAVSAGREVTGNVTLEAVVFPCFRRSSRLPRVRGAVPDG